MAGPYVINKYYQPLFTLDLRSAAQRESFFNAAVLRNLDIRESVDGDVLSQRWGFKAKGSLAVNKDAGGILSLSYFQNALNDGFGAIVVGGDVPNAGEFVDEIITVDSPNTSTKACSRLVRHTATITHSGAQVSVLVNLVPIGGIYKCTIVGDAVSLVDEDLGTGLEVSFDSLGDLKVIVDAVSGLALTTTGPQTTVPAAFLETTVDAQVASSSVGLSYCDMEAFGSFAFQDFTQSINDAEWRTVNAITIGSRTFISQPGYGGQAVMMTYDGHETRRSGPPEKPVITGVTTGAGSIPGALDYRYLAVVQIIDHQGNLIESLPSDEFSFTPGAGTASHSVTVTFEGAGTAFVAGGQTNAGTSGNPLVCDDGAGGDHGLQVGDVIYVQDLTATTMRQAVITERTSTTIVFGLVGVTMSDNLAVSKNNYRIALFRTVAGGNLFFQTGINTSYGTVSYPASGTSQVFTEDLLDAELGAGFLDPFFSHDELEDVVADVVPGGTGGGYLAYYQGSLVLAGAGGQTNESSTSSTVFYSSFEDAEYFHPTLSFRVEESGGGEITGVAATEDYLLVFQKRATSIVTGSLVANTFQVESLSRTTGCVAHNSIQEIDGSVIFLSEDGFYQISNGNPPQDIAPNLRPVFTLNKNLPEEEKLVFLKAQAVVDSQRKQYICHIPAQSTSGGDVYGNDNGRTFVFNYEVGTWQEWRGINAWGGIAELGNEFYFLSRELNDGAVDAWVYRSRSNGDVYDCVDHVTAIDTELLTGHENLGDASISKKYLQTKVFAPGGDTIPSYTWSMETRKNLSTTAHTQADFVMSSDVRENAIKLLPTKARTLQYRFTHETLHEKLLVSGLETKVSTNYKIDIKE